MKSLSSAAVARPPQDKRPRKPRSMDTMGRKRSKTGQFEKESYPSKDILMPEDVHNRRHVGKCIC